MGNSNHLALVENTDTGLIHGAMYQHAPTPSGCDRWLLSFTTTEGFSTEKAAAEAINMAFPDLAPIDIAKCSGEDHGVEGIIQDLPKGAMIIVISQRNRGEPLEPGMREVEVWQGNQLLDLALTPAQVKQLVKRGMADLDSTTGDNPDLHYRYDHYIVVGSGGSGDGHFHMN